MRHRHKITAAILVLVGLGAWVLLRQQSPSTVTREAEPALPAISARPEAIVPNTPLPMIAMRSSVSQAPRTMPSPIGVTGAGRAIGLGPSSQSAASQDTTAVTQPGASVAPIEPHAMVEAVRNAVQQYGAAFGGNPVGTNSEITRALNGNNPTHARFLDGIPGAQIDGNGNLIDQWGTPYFFHQLSGSDMEVRSAGPDGVMWTQDDIILK